MDINNIFNTVPIKIEKKIEEKVPEKKEDEETSVKSDKSDKPDPEREEKIIFIGNVPLECEKKDINTIFKEYGKIQKIWFRSVPIDNTLKLPKKAKVVLKKYNKTCKNKNCYLLFKLKSSKIKAITEKNNYILNGRHLHVTDSQKNDLNFKTTAFIGNLHYEADEEELREFFKDCGLIDYVRIVRDKHTFEGKGFGYVKFGDRDGLIKGLGMGGMEFMGLELRISKAKKREVGGRGEREREGESVNKANYLMRKSFKRNGGEGVRQRGRGRGRGGSFRGRRGSFRGRGGSVRGRGGSFRGRGGRGSVRGRGGRGSFRGRGGRGSFRGGSVRGRGGSFRGRRGGNRGGSFRGRNVRGRGSFRGRERSLTGRNGNVERNKKIQKKV